jgi:hypothetical protein
MHMHIHAHVHAQVTTGAITRRCCTSSLYKIHGDRERRGETSAVPALRLTLNRRMPVAMSRIWAVPAPLSGVPALFEPGVAFTVT